MGRDEADIQHAFYGRCNCHGGWAVFRQRLAAKVESFVATLRSRAGLSIAIRAGDADSKNLKLMRHESQLLATTAACTLHSFFPCALHSVSKTVGDACTGVGKQLVSALYCFGKLVRMGNYWSRLVNAVKLVLSSELRIVHSAPPAHAAEQRRLVCNLFFPRLRVRSLIASNSTR